MEEIRRNNSKKGRGHPAIVYLKEGDKYKYIGSTHAKITNGIKNVELNVNLNPKDKRKTYVKPKPEYDHKASFGKRERKWRVDPSDRETIENIKKNG